MSERDGISQIAQGKSPWRIVHYQDDMPAPAWVDSPDIRGTFDILQSCVLTLIACIYTALHLDIPTKTAWHDVFLYKLKWTVITLFAPEISLYMAADQLQQAWSLKSKLCELQRNHSPEKDHVRLPLNQSLPKKIILTYRSLVQHRPDLRLFHCHGRCSG